MGMDISAKLLYGCKYSELPEEILDEVDAMLDSDELEYASPTYDAPRDEWVIGSVVNINGATWTTASKAVDLAYEEIPDIIYREGVELRLIVSPDVT